MGIVQSLFKLINKKAKEENAKKVVGVSVSVGRYSGVEPELFIEAFNVLKKERADNSIARDAILDLSIVPLKIHCRTCDLEKEIEEIDMVCLFCNSVDTEVLAGQDIFITNMELAV